MADPEVYPESTVISSRDRLAQEVYEQIGRPLSVWAVAATLESIGIRDIDARQDFECDSVFELAAELYEELKGRAQKEQAEAAPGQATLTKAPLTSRLALFCKYYGQGLMFSLPMISQIAAILIFRYSLWAWLEFNEAQATVIAFGTIAAFVVTGGFTQTMGRSVTKYISEQNYKLALASVQKILKGGVFTTVGVALFLYLLNAVIPFYPHSMLVLGLVYFLLISMLLLFSGVLYALEQRLIILLIIVAGTMIVVAGMDGFQWGIYLSHWTGLILTNLMLAAYALGYLRLKIRIHRQQHNSGTLPGHSVRYYINYRYFLYGFLYFFFLFLDRILAWTAGPPPPPYIMWFNTPYELGMDWALLSLIFTIAVLEYSVNTFARQLLPLQQQASFARIDNFNAYFQRFYRRQLMLLIGVGIASVAITYVSVSSLRFLQSSVPEIRDFFTNAMTFRVFWMASISYLFVVIGLLHSLFFFTLNKPAFAVYSIGSAFVVNFFVGFLCSRIFGLEYAAAGLIAGALTFAIVSGIYAKKFFRKLDYYYYSAF